MELKDVPRKVISNKNATFRCLQEQRTITMRRLEAIEIDLGETRRSAKSGKMTPS